MFCTPCVLNGSSSINEDINDDVLSWFLHVQSDTWSLIYAYNEADPDGEDPFYHGRDNRGVKSVNLLDPQIGTISHL